jgi:hypothetical protein
MTDPARRPRLTRVEDILRLVAGLQRQGLSGAALYRRVTEIGTVDLDLLNHVLRKSATRLRHKAA